MPRVPRSQQEIDDFRREILDTALELIIQDGFQNLSMRKIASRLEMSATTIYHYFSSKDEINLMIRMHGFEMLHQLLEQCFFEQHDPLERLQGMIRAYFQFGIHYPGYYDIMFNMHTPKYLDYVGTKLEPAARTEKEASLRNYAITEKAVAALSGEGECPDAEQLMRRTIQLWCDAHGVISLYNSQLLREISDRPSGLLDELIEGVTARIAGFRKDATPPETARRRNG
ncbi:MAG: TetR/AcrR family transcriptional regulator [Thermodesulfobacteriota bacterium]